MNGFCFRGFVRKVLSGRFFQKGQHSSRRLPVRLHLEVLEDRRVTATLSLTSTPLSNALERSSPSSSGTSVSNAFGDLRSATNGAVNTAGETGYALGTLFSDIAQFSMPTQDAGLAPSDPGLTFSLPDINPVVGLGSTRDTGSYVAPPAVLPQPAASPSAAAPALPFAVPQGLGDYSSVITQNSGFTSALATPPDVAPAASPVRELLPPEAPPAPSAPATIISTRDGDTSDSTGTVSPAAERFAPARFTDAPSLLRESTTLDDSACPDVQTAKSLQTERDSTAREAQETRVGLSDAPVCYTQPETNHDGARCPAVAAETEVMQRGAKEFSRDVTDGSLLQRFVANRDQGAFATLVARHEQMVLGVSQRVLGDWHLAQDVFQATFVVLARKASMLDQDRPLASWLYRVAYHLALRWREVVSRQRRIETAAAKDPVSQEGTESSAEIEKQEMHQVLGAELQHLPEKYRVPLVLCYFDGKTHAEVAQAIGVPRGSIAKRIGEALEQLRERLVYRGITF